MTYFIMYVQKFFMKNFKKSVLAERLQQGTNGGWGVMVRGDEITEAIGVIVQGHRQLVEKLAGKLLHLVGCALGHFDCNASMFDPDGVGKGSAGGAEILPVHRKQHPLFPSLPLPPPQ